PRHGQEPRGREGGRREEPHGRARLRARGERRLRRHQQEEVVMAEKKAPAAKKPAARRKAKPEGASVEVVDAQNKKVGERLVSPDVFGAKINTHLLYEAVKQYRAGARAGTHKTKTRAMVSGTGKKPWKQKGTGRARVGEARNPLWRHGGTTFGPMPRDYSYSM